MLPVGIVTTLIKGDVFNWGQIMAGALLGAAPPLIIYAFLMDYYIAGLTAGAGLFAITAGSDPYNCAPTTRSPSTVSSKCFVRA